MCLSVCISCVIVRMTCKHIFQFDKYPYKQTSYDSWGPILQYRISLNPMTSHSYLTSISVAQLFRNFVQSTTASLPCSVQNFKTIGLPIDKLWAFCKIWINDELEMDFRCYNVVPILRGDMYGAVTISLQWPAHVLCLNHFSALTSTRVTLHPISDPGAPLVIPLPPLDGCQHSKEHCFWRRQWHNQVTLWFLFCLLTFQVRLPYVNIRDEQIYHNLYLMPTCHKEQTVISHKVVNSMMMWS